MKLTYHNEPSTDLPCGAKIYTQDGNFVAVGLGRNWQEARQRAINNARLLLRGTPPPPTEEGIEI